MADVARVVECRTGTDSEGGTADLRLRPGARAADGWQRRFYATSACGICGTDSIDAARAAGTPLPAGPVIDPHVLRGLPSMLRQRQRRFERTGGLHAAGVFTPEGTLVALREDVGRHNAVDKVVGRAAMRGLLPLHSHVLLVSGRASFEIVQKSLAAGIPALAAVSAPSSLAVRLAREAGMTLVGFLRDDGFNVYAGRERIAGI
jgi:FdhD protein